MPIRSLFWSAQLAACDLALLYACGIIAAKLRGYSEGLDNFTLTGLFLVAVSCFVALSLVGGYASRGNMTTLRYASEHALAMLGALVAAFVVTYAFSTYNSEIKPGRSVLLLGLIFFTPASWFYRYVIALRKWKEAETRYFWVAGGPELASFLREVCLGSLFPHPLRFVELANMPFFLDRNSRDRDGHHSRELCTVFSGEKERCEGIVVDLSHRQLDPPLQELLLKINLHAVPVYPLESFIETFFHKIALTQVNLTQALNGTFNADHHSVYGKIKALLDFVLCSLLLMAVLPVMLIIALAIKIGDGGPVFFFQRRAGRFEKPFTVFKFRTMHHSPADTGSDYTANGDSRITSFGKFLRLSRLDELPQLWNVIKGDMSLIGPRAEWCKLSEEYEKEIPLYHLRHMVKPGITGWAQVNYGYGAGLKDTLEKLQYDLYYIKHYSVQMDAAIVLKTVFTMLSGAGR